MPLTAGLALAGCTAADDGADATAGDAVASPAAVSPADADPGAADAAGDDGAGSPAGVMTLGDEQIAMESLRCFFEEQPRAGLGGVFTHTAQGRGTNAEGEAVVLDLSRARDEDGTVADDIIVDIGDPSSDDAVGLIATGPEGLIQFGDASVSASGVELSDLSSDPVELSFDLPCR